MGQSNPCHGVQQLLSWRRRRRKKSKGLYAVWYTVISVSSSLSNDFSCCLSFLSPSSSNSPSLCGIRIPRSQNWIFIKLKSPLKVYITTVCMWVCRRLKGLMSRVRLRLCEFGVSPRGTHRRRRRSPFNTTCATWGFSAFILQLKLKSEDIIIFIIYWWRGGVVVVEPICCWANSSGGEKADSGGRMEQQCGVFEVSWASRNWEI